MSSDNTYQAIAAVTKLIHNQLFKAHLEIEVGAPREDLKEKLYLFLYETEFDPHLKNYSLSLRKSPVIWLILKYLLIAYDQKDPRISNYKAYQDMGMAIRILHESNFLDPTAQSDDFIQTALTPNIEPLKITFDATPPDLISKILGDVNSKFQYCISFQIRPIMINSE